MIRKILLPALAIAMLGGCVTSGYEYRGGNGDYYYGQPQVEYRDYGSPYGGYGGYGPGWSGSFGFDYGYGSPYGYGGYGGYYDPYRYYYPYPRRPHHDHDHDHDHDGHQGNPDGDRHSGERNDRARPPPWRDPGGRSGLPGMNPPPQRPIESGVRAPMPPSGARPSMPQRPVLDPPQSRPATPRSGERRSDSGTREPDRDIRRKREP